MVRELDDAAPRQMSADSAMEPEVEDMPIPTDHQYSNTPDLEQALGSMPSFSLAKTSTPHPFDYNPEFSPFKRETYPRTGKDLWGAIISYMRIGPFHAGPPPGTTSEDFNLNVIKPEPIIVGEITDKNGVNSDRPSSARTPTRGLFIPHGHQRLSSGLLGHNDYANFRSKYLQAHWLTRIIPHGLISFNYWLPSLVGTDEIFGESGGESSPGTCRCGRDSVNTAVFMRVYQPRGDVQLLPDASSSWKQWPLEYYVASLLERGEGLSDPKIAADSLASLDSAINWLERSNGVTDVAEFMSYMKSFYDGYQSTTHGSLLSLLNSDDFPQHRGLIPALCLPVRFARMVEFLCIKYPTLFASAPTVAMSLIEEGVTKLSENEYSSFIKEVDYGRLFRGKYSDTSCAKRIFSTINKLSSEDSPIGRLSRTLQYSSLIVGFTHTEAVPLATHDILYPPFIDHILAARQNRLESKLIHRVQNIPRVAYALFVLQELRSVGLPAIRLGHRLPYEIPNFTEVLRSQNREFSKGLEGLRFGSLHEEELQKKEQEHLLEVYKRSAFKRISCAQEVPKSAISAFGEGNTPSITARQFLCIGTVAYIRAKLVVALIIVFASVPLGLYFWLSIAFAAIDTFSNYASLALLLTGAILGVGPSVYRKDWAYHDFIRFRMPARNLSELGKRGAEYFSARQREGTHAISGTFASPYPTETSEGTGLVADVPTQLSSIRDMGPAKLAATDLGAYIIYWPDSRKKSNLSNPDDPGTVIFARYTPGVTSQMLRGRLPFVHDVSSVAYKDAHNFEPDIYFG